MSAGEHISTPPSPAPEDCLVGGGEMGALMRACDWASTPLGPVAEWPQSLRTSVSICLNSRFAMLIWWGDDLVMLYNDAYRKVLGNKHPWALGRAGREVWPEIWDIVGTMLQSVRETQQATWSDDLLLLLERHGYSEECYFTFSYSPIRDESGGIGGIFTPVAETTEKVIGERRLRTLRDLAARSVEARQVDDACRIVTETLATNPDDIPFSLLYMREDGSPTHLAGKSGLDDAVPVEWPVESIFETGQAELITNVAEQFASLPNEAGSSPVQQALLLPVTLPGHAAPTAVLVAAVSPRKALDGEYRAFFDLVAGHVAVALAEATAYEEERHRAEALAALDHAKTTFFSNVSHEFRTPLTLILGPVEDALAAHGQVSGADLEAVHRNSLRLLRLVNTLLDFSRLEAGRLEAHFEPTDLAAETAGIAGVFRSTIERAGLRLVVDCPPLPEPVYIDRGLWEKILLNLLSNALKFTMAGEIAVRLRATPEAVELTVQDTGIGIASDELPRLFERFHRAAEAAGRTHEGTGIGLALVQELVILHGGIVRAESTLNQGSQFMVTIPRGTAHLPTESISNVSGSSSPQTAPQYLADALRWTKSEETSLVPATTPHGHILVADDNADMREYIQRILGTRHEIETVTDGKAALEAIHRRRPDVVLSDIMMPRLDGLGLLAALRADPETSSLPVIFLSARAGEEARVEGLEAGADDYLVKPFSARELLARVGTHLELARARRAAYDHERQIAVTLQQALLAVPPENAFPGLELRTEYEAALDDADVGGDFLDAFNLPDGRVALVVGDVSGKGLEAAAHTAEIKYALRALLREYPSPEIALTRLNSVLCDAHSLDHAPREGFICLSLAVVNTRTGDLLFSAAGAEPPLIMRAAGGAEAVPVRGTPLIVSPKAEYQTVQGKMEPGDLLLMVTDGITEARRDREFFGYEGLMQSAQRTQGLNTLSQITQTILQDARSFGGGLFRDDVCLLLARRNISGINQN